MRGIPSLITEIRKKVFTEVARMAYSGDYTDMEDIPFKIVPGQSPLHRESVFLERVVTKVVEVDNKKVTTFEGNYTAYSQKKAMLREAAYHAWVNQQQEIHHQEEVIAKLKSFNREKSIKRAESREKMLDKIEIVDKPQELNDKMNIKLEPNVVSGNDVLTISGLSKSFDDITLFDNIDIEIKRGERVALIGNNGTGKTTILKLINGIIEPDSGSIYLGAKVNIGYYDQEHHVLDPDKTIFDEIRDAYPGRSNPVKKHIFFSG